MTEELQLLISHLEMAQTLQQCVEDFRNSEKRIEAHVKATETRLGIQGLTDEDKRLWSCKTAELRPAQVLWLLMCLQTSKSTLAAFLEDTRTPEPSLLTYLLNDMIQQVRSEIPNN